MKNYTNYEQKGIFQKVREYFSLFVFIIIILTLAIILSDIFIFPLTYFSVKNPGLYTNIFKLSFWIVLITYFLLKVILNFISLRKNELSLKEIFQILVINKMKNGLTVIILLVLFVIVIFLTASVLENNYIFIYKLLH